MSAIWLLLIGLVLFVAAYAFYGSLIIKKLGGVDPTAKTPAHALRDDVDYIPTPFPIVFGHHFASIAGAGPIVGPIVAAVFGWLPVFLWIVLGGIFIGAVHDVSTLYASIRHRAKSIAEILLENVGLSGKRLFAAFAWLTLVLIVGVFAFVIATTFTGTPSVATASVLFIVLAIAFGYVVQRRGAPLLVSTIVGVVLLALCVWLGTLFPISLPRDTWIPILLIYALLAASLPMWLILQPRDYLNSFLLYGFMGGALIAIFIANPTIQLPAFTTFETNIGFLFPILFVTVACGAISGFHSLVSSGTTAKQLSSEAHIKPIGYGGMLLESLLAIVSLITAAYLLMGDYTRLLAEKGWGGIFATGAGTFLTAIGIPLEAGAAFAGLVLSAFALTTLDTATRLGRFMLQELVSGQEKGKPSAVTTAVTNRWVAGTIGVVLAGWLALGGGWRTLWPLFGSANQLIGALALLAITVWLARAGKSNWFVLYPMLFMLAVTMTALVVMFLRVVGVDLVQTIFTVLLFILAIVLVYLAITKLKTEAKQKGRAPGD